MARGVLSAILLATMAFAPVAAKAQVDLIARGLAAGIPGRANTWTSPQTFKAGPLFDVKAYGAKGDERFVTDAAMTSGSPTVTSATAAFTAADTGKTLTVNAGSAGVGSGTYTSGGTVTGSAGQTCTLSTFNNGGTGATATVQLTGTNTIAGGTTLVITAPGSGFTSAPTSATLGNGTATCSGTATISTTRWYAPLTGTLTYVNATTATLSVNATNTVSGANAAIGTDDSAAVTSAIQAAYNAGGGSVYFPPGTYLILSQLAIPNDGGAGFNKKQVPLRLFGQGGVWDGVWGAVVPGASMLDLRYSGAGKIGTYGRGSLSIEHLGLIDYGYDTTPFIDVGYTTVFIRDNSFGGSGPGAAASINDAVQTGVTVNFQGYGSVIERNFFHRIHRGFYGYTWTNSVLVKDNTFSLTSGGSEAFKLDGSVGIVAGNVFSGNLIEVTNYTYGFNLTNTSNNALIGNAFWDVGTNWLSPIILGGTSPGNVCLLCYGFSGYASALTDGAGNNVASLQTTSSGAQLSGLTGIAIGPVAPSANQINIKGATPWIRMTYPGVIDLDLKVDNNGYANWTGAFRYNFGSVVKSASGGFLSPDGISIGATGGAQSSSTTGRFWSSDPNAMIRLTIPGTADFDIQPDSSGNMNFKGATTNYTFDKPVKFGGTNTTGSGSAALGSNSPATTNTAPYTWIQAKAADGSTVYIPAWK